MSGIYSKPNTSDIVLQFICKIIWGKITINDEADEIKYFAFEDIPKNTIKKHIFRINDVLKNPNKFYMKEQIGKT